MLGRLRSVLGSPAAQTLALSFLLSAPAHALFLGTCSISATSVNFGTYSPLAPTGLGSTGSIIVTCTGLALVTVPVTVSLNPGLTGSFAARRLTGGASILTYNLYRDAGDSQVWGDGSGATFTVALSVFILAVGSGSAGATVYGLIPAGQDVTPRTYGDTITATVNY